MRTPFTNSLETHRAQPDVSLKSHVTRRRLELGEEVNSKYRIYLDLRFWILLREAYLEKGTKNSISILLEQLLSLVEAGRAICPISESVFVELFKQDDPASRIATANLIDALSCGVSLIVHPERVRQELCNSLYKSAGAQNLFSVEQLVWTKLASIFGEVHPTGTPFEAAEELVIQKAFYDHMWNISLAEMAKSLDPSQMPKIDWDETAKRLNNGNKEHENEITNYRKAYRFEFEGSLSLFKQEMLVLFKEIEEAGYHSINAINCHLSESARFAEFSRSIRTLHIGASCHAAVRWDKKRKITGNDLFDFHHAEAALGYCDLFLTEGPLRTLLNQNHLELKEHFPCKVVASIQEAIEAIGDIR